jgi:hypothetical protein
MSDLIRVSAPAHHQNAWRDHAPTVVAVTRVCWMNGWYLSRLAQSGGLEGRQQITRNVPPLISSSPMCHSLVATGLEAMGRQRHLPILGWPYRFESRSSTMKFSVQPTEGSALAGSNRAPRVALERLRRRRGHHRGGRQAGRCGAWVFAQTPLAPAPYPARTPNCARTALLLQAYRSMP